MGSIVYAGPEFLSDGEAYVPLREHRPLDWEHVARAFRAANQAVGWGAEVTLSPERQHALVCYPRERAEHVANTITIFHRVIERHIGVDAFRSIAIDLEARSASSVSLASSDMQRTR